jgi:hypothetical protein
MRMSSPTPDHRSIASEWQTTSLLVPKESHESDGAGLRWPYGDTFTNAVSTSTRLCTRETGDGQENSYLFSSVVGTFFTPVLQIVGLNLADDSKMLIW